MANCSQCGKPIPVDMYSSICPTCLMQANMVPDSSETKELDENYTKETVAPDEIQFINDGISSFGQLIGHSLAGFEIIRKLGKGGMGEVYKAREQSLNRMIALKILTPSLTQNSGFVERFKREAQAAARLNHPNIVPIYSIGEDQGYYYFTMEYIQGVNLSEQVAAKKQLQIKATIRIGLQVASALQTAQKEGIVHRDIKPQNIMIDKAARVRVLDFGLAQIADLQSGLTAEGSFLGTPTYASPEQCENEKLDTRSDLWSLGTVLYECLTGVPAFKSDSLAGLVKQIVMADPKTISEFREDVPEDLEKVIFQLLEKERGDRFQSSSPLIKELKRIYKELDGEASSAEKSSEQKIESKRDAVPVLTQIDKPSQPESYFKNLDQSEEPAQEEESVVQEVEDEFDGKSKGSVKPVAITAIIVVVGLAGFFFFDFFTGSKTKTNITAVTPADSTPAPEVVDEVTTVKEDSDEVEEDSVLAETEPLDEIHTVRTPLTEDGYFLLEDAGELDYPLREAEVVIHNGKILLFGGRVNDARDYWPFFINIMKYDPLTFRTKHTEFNNMRDQAAVVKYGDHIYLAGGTLGNWTSKDEVFKIDPDTYESETVGNLVRKNIRMGYVVYDDKLVMFGGHHDGRPDLVKTFDFKTNETNDVATMPFGMPYCEAFLWNDQALVFAGEYKAGNGHKFLIYNLKNNKVVSVHESPIEYLERTSAYFLYDDMVYMFRNEPADGEQGYLFRLDPETNEWAISNLKGDFFDGAMAAVLNKHVYVLGGTNHEPGIPLTDYQRNSLDTEDDIKVTREELSDYMLLSHGTFTRKVRRFPLGQLNQLTWKPI